MWSNVNWNQRYMWGSDSNKISYVSSVTSDALKKKNTKKNKIFYGQTDRRTDNPKL
jgi:hypothetical protein